MTPTDPHAAEGPEVYCRQVEAYLCRKNDGHLVRVVGPAFESVCAWATRGVPLKVAYRGIDRYFERYYAKGPRRRPVRVEFCEADVLDAFDEWRRAVGVPVERATGEGGADAPQAADGDASDARKPGSLPAHLEKVIAQLTALRAGADRSLDLPLESIVRELDEARAMARNLRGEARTAFTTRLRDLDGVLAARAREHTGATVLQELGLEADAELAPYRSRMPPDAFARSREVCLDRLLRERLGLPVIAYE